MQFIALIAFIAGFIVLTEIKEEWFDWLSNPYIKYPFFVLGLFTATSRRNFVVGAATLALEIPVFIILSMTGFMESHSIQSYFILLGLVIPGAMIGLWLFEKFWSPVQPELKSQEVEVNL